MTNLTFRGKPVYSPDLISAEEDDSQELIRLAKLQEATGEGDYFMRSRVFIMDYDPMDLKGSMAFAGHTNLISAEAVLNPDNEDFSKLRALYGHLGEGTHYIFVVSSNNAVFEEITIVIPPSERHPLSEDSEFNPFIEAEEEQYSPSSDLLSFMLKEVAKNIALGYENSIKTFMDSFGPEAEHKESSSIIV